MEADEIDLIDLYNAFKKTKLYKAINNSVHSVLKNKILFLLILISGGVGGYFYEKNLPKIYRSEMITDSKAIDNFTCNQIVSLIDTLLDTQNLEELEKIGFEKNLHSELKKVEFIYPQFGKETLIKTEPFRISVYTSNPNNFELIESSILNYLLNNLYSKKDEERKLALLKSEETELNSELSIIDSTLQLLHNHIASNNNPAEFAALIREQKNAKQRIEEIKIEILNNNNFVVLNSFTRGGSLVVNKNYYALKFSLLAFFIGFIVLRLFKK